MKYNIKSYSQFQLAYQKFLYGLCKRHFYYITSPLRVLPDFFVIGVVRSGTTSLFHYLGQHPSIRSASYDEIGYFDENYHLGINWYKSLFPTKFTKKQIQKNFKQFLTYDVTPFYIYNPLVIKRIKQNFPHSKIIANLRNPIDRAYSNYNLTSNNTQTFEEVIESEIFEINNIGTKLNDKNYLVNDFYEKILPRGFYADQLELWYKHFPKEQIHIISSEEFSKNTDHELRNVFEFLNIPYVEIPDLTKQNVRKFPPMKNETRKVLLDFFKPYNEKLFSLINTRFNWDR